MTRADHLKSHKLQYGTGAISRAHVLSLRRPRGFVGSLKSLRISGGKPLFPIVLIFVPAAMTVQGQIEDPWLGPRPTSATPAPRSDRYAGRLLPDNSADSGDSALLAIQRAAFATIFAGRIKCTVTGI